MSGTESFTLDRLFAILAAFAGLALALLTPHTGLDWRGVAWAVLSAVSFSTVLVASGRTMRGIDRRILMLYLTSTATVVVTGISLFSDLAPGRIPDPIRSLARAGIGLTAA